MILTQHDIIILKVAIVPCSWNKSQTRVYIPYIIYYTFYAYHINYYWIPLTVLTMYGVGIKHVLKNTFYKFTIVLHVIFLN